jgi:anhydro-N-acetylmuramic acid kinase
MAERLIIGAMSGTSADGIDVALVRVNGRGLDMTAQCIGHCHRPYPPDVRQAIFDVRSSVKTELSSLANLGRQITLEYARIVGDLMLAASVTAAEIAAIAAHGQTLFHQPPLTMQWFDPALLAWETGCTVISDFRRADCAAGGQGAPLVPFADYVLFRHPKKNRVLLNIGGIANLTYLRAGGSVNDVVAFDTGPGNCISDWLVREHQTGAAFDEGGAKALEGTPLHLLVSEMLNTVDYFRQSLPKSTDTPSMLDAYRLARQTALRKHGSLNFADELASAAKIVAMSIIDALDNSAGRRLPWDELFVSGGGAHNAAIMKYLRAAADGGRTVNTSEVLGVSAESKEAIAFALLGAATLDGVASNVPSVTGAKRAVVLGSVTPVSVTG